MTFRLLSEAQPYSCGKCLACRTGYAAMCEHPKPETRQPPLPITVMIPRKTWRLLRLGAIRVTGDHSRIWLVEPRGANAFRVTMDARRAIEIRENAGSASQDRTAFTARERQAIWRIIPRITQQLERLERSK